ncbi:hypothetical protein [Xanthomonas melonis]|uniref:hypothetical protein n=1 Tax=Xanthomonas melonis TaxID=56456 RepID=UPI001E61E2D6|nr:hypothetical protein [Xanthomonas melonis]MCD0244420.1 hypothetical protein [Xanthomonas melonis]
MASKAIKYALWGFNAGFWLILSLNFAGGILYRCGTPGCKLIGNLLAYLILPFIFLSLSLVVDFIFCAARGFRPGKAEVTLLLITAFASGYSFSQLSSS